MSRAGAVLLLAAALGAWNLWAYDLWAPDEPYFGEGAREMVADGQWAVPHVNGVVTTDKPPLFFWLIAAFSLPFGAVSPLTARLPSLLAGIGTVALTIRLGRRLGGARHGAMAGWVLATTYLPWDKTRSSQIDALLCFLVLAAISAFEAYRAGDARGRPAGILFWTAAALAVIAKGPVGLLLPLGIAIVTLALDRELPAWRSFAPLTGPLLFLGIVGSWIALAQIGGHGEYSVWGAFEKHVLSRAIHGLHHRQPPWYYAEVLPVQLLPWSGLLPGALLLAWWRRRERSDRFLLVWSSFVVLLFSISTEKRDLYVLPAYPAFALLFARLIVAVEGSGPEDAGRARAPHRRWVTVPLALTGGILALTGIGLPLAVRRFPEFPTAPALVLAAALLSGGVAMAVASLRGRVRGATLATVAAASLVFLAAASAVYPALDPFRSARGFAAEVKSISAASRAAGEPVLAYRIGNLPQAIAFYSNGLYTRETSDPAELAMHLMKTTEVFALADRSQLDLLPPAALDRVRVLRSADLASRSVVLISNRGAGPGEGRSAAPPVSSGGAGGGVEKRSATSRTPRAWTG
jgi:4-amino-4-deoxy-L-arabinose transferase-like glycosyltransferase